MDLNAQLYHILYGLGIGWGEPTTWAVALKKWNEGNCCWIVPRHGCPEYDEVKKIEEEIKRKSLPIRKPILRKKPGGKEKEKEKEEEEEEEEEEYTEEEARRDAERYAAELAKLRADAAKKAKGRPSILTSDYKLKNPNAKIDTKYYPVLKPGELWHQLYSLSVFTKDLPGSINLRLQSIEKTFDVNLDALVVPLGLSKKYNWCCVFFFDRRIPEAKQLEIAKTYMIDHTFADDKINEDKVASDKFGNSSDGWHYLKIGDLIGKKKRIKVIKEFPSGNVIRSLV